MRIKFIPGFIKRFLKRIWIQFVYGREGNRIKTTEVHRTVKLGKHIELAKGVSIRAQVKIDDYSYCSPNTVIFSGSTIGKFCSIGYNVQIGVPEHPVDFFTTSPSIYRDSKAAVYCQWAKNDINIPAIIENDVWIGSNAIIMQGIRVGNGSVVAAGAVVTKDVPPYTIVGGVPAKIIRKRLTDETIQKLQKAEWWNHDIEWIEKFADEQYGGK